jgi:hypothetical protein
MSDGIDLVKRLETLRYPEETDNSLAKRAGIKVSTLRDWILLSDAGRDFCPRVKTVRTAAENLGVKAAWLLMGEGSAQGPDKCET